MFDSCRRYVARVVDGYEPVLPFFDESPMFPTKVVTVASVTAKTPFNSDWERDVTEAWFLKAFGQNDGPKYAQALLPTDATHPQPALHVYELSLQSIVKLVKTVVQDEVRAEVAAEQVHKAVHRHDKPARVPGEKTPFIEVGGTAVEMDSETRTFRICTTPFQYRGFTAAICLALIIAVVFLVLAIQAVPLESLPFWVFLALSVVFFSIMFVCLYLSEKKKRD